MKVVVREPSLLVLVGWILLGLTVEKPKRSGPRMKAAATPPAGLLASIRQARDLWKQRWKERWRQRHPGTIRLDLRSR
jgi:hypothetical protein